jgi:hypothetical protein
LLNLEIEIGALKEMITIMKKQKIIIDYFTKGLNKTEIAVKTGLDWKTVNKYVQQYQDAKDSLIQKKDAARNLEIIESITEAPKYNILNRKKRKITEELILEVQKCIDDNKLKRERGQKKQQMKKVDIFNHVIALGFDIGSSSVNCLINDLESQAKEAFIKQEYSPGDICEFDWGEVKIKIKGEIRKFYIAVFTSAYSNYRFAVIFNRQNTQAFWRSHALFFDHIGGVYSEMVYDNMRVAVKKFIGYSEKEPTEGLLKLSMYYLFNFRFCNIGKGNEKGHVERSVEYVRRKAFCKKDAFESLEEANKHLLDTCIRLNNNPQKSKNNKTSNEVLIEEKPHLTPAPVMFECAEIDVKRIDSYSTASVFGNRYSVPEEYVGKMIDIKIYPENLIFYFNSNKVCEHERSYEYQKWFIILDHYLKTLRTKPGALQGSVALKQSDIKLKNLYIHYYKGRERDFIELLLYKAEKGKTVDRIESAITELKQIGIMEITTDKIKTICERNPIDAVYLKSPESEIEQMSIAQLNIHTSLLQNDTYFHSNGGES